MMKLSYRIYPSPGEHEDVPAETGLPRVGMRAAGVSVTAYELKQLIEVLSTVHEQMLDGTYSADDRTFDERAERGTTP